MSWFLIFTRAFCAACLAGFAFLVCLPFLCEADSDSDWDEAAFQGNESTHEEHDENSR